MNGYVRAAIAAAVLGLGAWVGNGVYRAGGDVPPPTQAANQTTKLTAGHAEGRRIDGKRSWSLDYDRLVASADSTVATLEHVRHGEFYKRGKPFMAMTAEHVVVNTLSNDFIVTGPLVLVQNDGKHKRRLTSDAATYSGALQTLTLTHPSDITSDGNRIKVATATVNFGSGDMQLGRLIGFF